MTEFFERDISRHSTASASSGTPSDSPNNHMVEPFDELMERAAEDILHLFFTVLSPVSQTLQWLRQNSDYLKDKILSLVWGVLKFISVVLFAIFLATIAFIVYATILDLIYYCSMIAFWVICWFAWCFSVCLGGSERQQYGKQHWGRIG